VHPAESAAGTNHRRLPFPKIRRCSWHSLQNVIVVRPVKNQTIRVLTSSGALVECVYGNANSGAFIDLPGLET